MGENKYLSPRCLFFQGWGAPGDIYSFIFKFENEDILLEFTLKIAVYLDHFGPICSVVSKTKFVIKDV